MTMMEREDRKAGLRRYTHFDLTLHLLDGHYVIGQDGSYCRLVDRLAAAELSSGVASEWFHGKTFRGTKVDDGTASPQLK